MSALPNKDMSTLRKLHTPTSPPTAPQVYQLDKVPTWMKVLVGVLSGAVVALAVTVVLLWMRTETLDAKWFVTSKEVARIEGQLED